MWHLNGRGVRRCNDTSVTSAGARWNAFWSGNAVGGYAAAQGAVALELAAERQAELRRYGYERG